MSNYSEILYKSLSIPLGIMRNSYTHDYLPIMILLTKTCVNHYPPPKQLLDLKQITIVPLSKYRETLCKTLYIPVYNIEKSNINHFPIPAQLQGNPIHIIICPLTNYWEILHKLLSAPWAVLLKSYTNHCLPRAIIQESHRNRYLLLRKSCISHCLPIKRLPGNSIQIIIHTLCNG